MNGSATKQFFTVCRAIGPVVTIAILVAMIVMFMLAIAGLDFHPVYRHPLTLRQFDQTVDARGPNGAPPIVTPDPQIPDNSLQISAEPPSPGAASMPGDLPNARPGVMARPGLENSR